MNFIQFNKEIYNINYIICIREPLKSQHCKDKYVIRLITGHNNDSETFDTEAEALKRYEELKQILTTKN